VQASSEHSLCFAVLSVDALRAQRVLRTQFAEAIRTGQVAEVEHIKDCAVLAAVGQRMARNRGIAATLFSALAKAGVNIKAMAQGSSEYNITVCIGNADITRALRAVHSRFFLSTTFVNLAVLGAGAVGSTLLDQIDKQVAQLRERFKLDLRVLAISRSDRLLCNDRGVLLLALVLPL
jgi:bifunctional aspartokinase / homoserine dehydrogenase 1